MRSSHAERDGKVFSWDNPPEGGHPGEDYNCRCWAEDVEDDKYKCERILWEVEAAWQRHDDLHEPILKAEAKVLETEQRLENLLSELEEVQHEIMMLAVPDRPSKIIDKGTIFGLGAMAYQYKKLKEREAQLLREINGVKWVLGKAKEKLNQLESKREDHKLNAISMTRQYKECLATHKKS